MSRLLLLLCVALTSCGPSIEAVQVVLPTDDGPRDMICTPASAKHRPQPVECPTVPDAWVCRPVTQ